MPRRVIHSVFSTVASPSARAPWVAFVASVLLPATAGAQPTNADILANMAVECVRPVTTPYSSVAISPDPANPFVNLEVISAIRADGKDVYLVPDTDSDSASGSPADVRLTFFVEAASVRYTRRGRGRLGRTVDLRLSYLLSDSTWRVIADSSCSPSFADEISRASLDAVEDESIPLTMGKRPRRSWIRRYAEPVVVAGATAVAVYLFFNVRSDSNDSP